MLKCSMPYLKASFSANRDVRCTVTFIGLFTSASFTPVYEDAQFTALIEMMRHRATHLIPGAIHFFLLKFVQHRITIHKVDATLLSAGPTVTGILFVASHRRTLLDYTQGTPHAPPTLR